MVCGVRVGVMAGAALGCGSWSGPVPAHIWAGQEAKKRNRGPLLAAGLCWLSLSALFWGEPLSGGVSLLSHTLADTPSLFGDSKPSWLTVVGSSSQSSVHTENLLCVLLVTKL